MMKRLLKITGICLAVLLLILFLAPFLFKGKIVQIVKQQINDRLTAKVDFGDLDLSFFRHFPRVSLALSDLRVTGTGVFEGDTLAAVKDIDVAVDLMSVIRGSNMTIHSILLDQPRIHLMVMKDGQANYLITKPDTTAKAGGEGGGGAFKMELQRYTIRDGYLSYDDAGGDIHTTVAHLDHSGSGDFTADLFTLSTDTKAGAVSFSYGGVPYLNDNAVNIGADIQVDAKAMKFGWRTDGVTVNALQLSSDGSFQLVNDSTYAMDIRFKMPSAEFKNLLSLVPSIYKKDFGAIKTRGQAALEGSVKGTYSPSQIPAYHVRMEVKDGFFQYPDLPQAVQNINLQLQVDNPDGITDHTVVDLRQGHLEMAGAPFDFRLLLKNPMTSRYIDAAAKGKLDLSRVTQLVKLEPGTLLKGIVDADVQVRGSVVAAQKQQLEGFFAAGTIALADLGYRSKAYSDGVEIHKAMLRWNPANVALSEMSGKVQQTNFSAEGSLSNLLGYALKSGTLGGVLTVKADKIDLNKWMPADSAAAGATAASAPGAASGTAGSGQRGVFLVPANIDFTLNAAVDQVHYDKTDYNNVTGVLLVKDETVTLKDIRMQALDGTIAMSGSYSTKENKTNPAISFSYDVQKLEVQKTFNAFNTVQKLAPIGKFISGTLSSSLTVKGNLGKDLKPELNSLTGGGNLEILQGLIGHFPPLDKIASTLNVSELKEVALQDIRNSFEFANGKVLVKPFHVKVKDIDMQVGGMHGIDESIDYAINMKLPRSLLGGAGNALINNLASQAASKGVNISPGETVNLDLRLGGTLTNPQLKTDLKGAAGNMADALKQQAVSFAQAKADSAKRVLKDTVAALKAQALGAAKDELARRLAGRGGDSAKGAASAGDTAAPAADLGKKAAEAGKGLIKGLFGKKKTDTVKH
ncbi:MAG TPA: AsmA-like C-terminal region-containing protein [Puia sp.]|uniref:AsmA family protein n=1 Tax=Puia sp. TaxID=2045100 RepID=UPI002C66D10B|nr:AsmA-like C-terminal region-containing protein [Puia sp.]HVU95288.1 AsmA-like C-terminal region-containing protein [Puia sp.]